MNKLCFLPRLRTVRDVVNPAFREACEMLGLLETDKSLDDALTEATSFQMPCALRKMFAFIIILCEYTYPWALGQAL